MPSLFRAIVAMTLVAMTLIVAVAASAFALTRILVAEDNNGASAQLGPSGGCPTPPFAVHSTPPPGSAGPTSATPALVFGPTPLGGGTPPVGSFPPSGVSTVAPPPPQATASSCLPRNPTIDAISQQLQAEARKSNFVGVLNGITLYGPGFSSLDLARQRSPQ